MNRDKTTITVKLDEHTAMRLAQLCKRAIVERIEPFAANEAEACEMMKAIDALHNALYDQGFDPR
jgi:hypothetical protein